MITAFADPFDTLFQIQSALQAREASNWLQNPADWAALTESMTIWPRRIELVIVVAPFE